MADHFNLQSTRDLMSNEEQSQSRPVQFTNKCTQNHLEESSECFEIILNGSGRKNRIS